MTPSQMLHKNDKLCGAVAEALVAAYALLSAAGKLSSYRPFTDVDGKDIVIDLAGGFKDSTFKSSVPSRSIEIAGLQVTCASTKTRSHRVRSTSMSFVCSID